MAVRISYPSKQDIETVQLQLIKALSDEITAHLEQLRALIAEPELVTNLRRQATLSEASEPFQNFARLVVSDAMERMKEVNHLHLMSAVKRPVDQSATTLFLKIDELLPVIRERHSAAAIEKMVDALVETNDPLANVYRHIDAANARARYRFIEQIETVDSDAIAKAAGHTAKNRSQTASRWKASGLLFSVLWRGHERYPAFQFKEGRPLPVIATILKALPKRFSPWEVAFWFVSSNRWLDGKAPYKCLDDEKKVARAAAKHADTVLG